jgi:hypothetical protein
LQSANPALHVLMEQSPLTQAGVSFTTAQVVPHDPQLVMLVLVLTHEPPQFVVPEPQAKVQAPDEQTCPEAQILAQPPQLFESLCVLTQMPLQAAWPLPQLRLQLPLPSHVLLMPQVVPCAANDFPHTLAVHVLVMQVVFVPQSEAVPHCWQTPDTQISPPEQSAFVVQPATQIPPTQDPVWQGV